MDPTCPLPLLALIPETLLLLEEQDWVALLLLALATLALATLALESLALETLTLVNPLSWAVQAWLVVLLPLLVALVDPLAWEIRAFWLVLFLSWAEEVIQVWGIWAWLLAVVVLAPLLLAWAARWVALSLEEEEVLPLEARALAWEVLVWLPPLSPLLQEVRPASLFPLDFSRHPTRQLLLETVPARTNPSPRGHRDGMDCNGMHLESY